MAKEGDEAVEYLMEADEQETQGFVVSPKLLLPPNDVEIIFLDEEDAENVNQKYLENTAISDPSVLCLAQNLKSPYVWDTEPAKCAKDLQSELRPLKQNHNEKTDFKIQEDGWNLKDKCSKISHQCYAEKKRHCTQQDGDSVCTFICTECGLCCENLAAFTVHQNSHKGSLPFICSDGGIQFSHKNTLKHEQIRMQKKLIKSDSFDDQFNGGKVAAHQYIHARKFNKLGKSSFKCNDCTTNFVNQSSFDRHKKECAKKVLCRVKLRHRFRSNKEVIAKTQQKVHINKTTFKCSSCAKSFSEMTALTLHQKFHKNQPAFKCSSCGTNFSSKNALLQHVQTHKQKNPLKCSLCNDRFHNYGHLALHQQVHAKEFRSKKKNSSQCSHCKINFMHKSRLIKHRSWCCTGKTVAHVKLPKGHQLSV